MLEKSGFKIQQIVIGHEASKLLAAPAKPVPIKIPKVKKPKKAPIGIAKVLTASMKLVVGVVAAAASVMVFVMGTALGTVLLLDPTVIVVLEDGTWLECMSWYE